MLSREENELLTRIGPGTPMGETIRRYWVPALLTEELPDPDGPPVQVGLLGEVLVAFRDSEGRVGLLDEHCSHRGTSLFYGRNEECGLRCIYHGWKYDVHGNVLDTPAEPVDSQFKHKIRHPAYHTREVNGIVYAYLGPRERMPLFPDYEWLQAPAEKTYVTKCLLECSYLQGFEGEVDPAHASFLHQGFRGEVGAEGADYTRVDRCPQFEVDRTDFGFRMTALRSAGEGKLYLRVTSVIMPLAACVAVGSINSRGRMDGFEVHWYVPYDNQRTWRYDFGFRRENPLTERDLHRRKQIGPDYRRVRTSANHYLQDRELQRTVDFTGIEDFLNEDACATESMGPLCDRTREHLGVSDQAVIALRQMLLDAIKVTQQGGDPLHVLRDPAGNHFPHVDSTAAVVPGPDWRRHFPHLTNQTPGRGQALAARSG